MEYCPCVTGQYVVVPVDFWVLCATLVGVASTESFLFCIEFCVVWIIWLLNVVFGAICSHCIKQFSIFCLHSFHLVLCMLCCFVVISSIICSCYFWFPSCLSHCCSAVKYPVACAHWFLIAAAPIWNSVPSPFAQLKSWIHSKTTS